MTDKTCFKCGESKRLDDFYKHKMMADGHLNKCKACAKRDVMLHRAENIEKVRAYDKRRAKLPHRKMDAASRCSAFKGQQRAIKKVYREVRAGNLVREPCESCGVGGAVAHHDDYSKQLNVRWLCRSCHRNWHVANGPGKNRE